MVFLISVNWCSTLLRPCVKSVRVAFAAGYGHALKTNFPFAPGMQRMEKLSLDRVSFWAGLARPASYPDGHIALEGDASSLYD